MLVPLNSTMIAVALPRLAHDLHASLRSATWLVTAYLVAMAALQPVAGRLGDRVGRRPLVLGGLVWFAAASAGAAAAGSLAVLIAFRLLQAVAGALLLPNLVALVREAVAPGRLGASLGLFGAAVTLGASAGPPLGGVLSDAVGWRAIFLVNLPLAALALALGMRVLPRTARRTAPAAADRAGAGLRVRVLLRGPFGAAAAGVALSNLAMYVTVLAVPVLLERRGGDGATAGLMLAAMTGASLVVTPAGGRLVDRAGPRPPAVAGLGLLAAALVPLALAPATLPEGAIVACLVVAGTGLGLAASALQVAAVTGVAAAAAGSAAGLFATSRYAGSITGTLLLAGPLAPAASGPAGFAVLFAVLVVAAAAAFAAALRLPGARGREPAAEPGRSGAGPAPARA